MARKTIDEIDVARTAVAASLTKPGLSDQQKIILSGMSVALCWAAGAGGESLQRLIDGEEIEAGRKSECRRLTHKCGATVKESNHDHPLCPFTVEACAKGCEELAKYKSKVASDALRQAAKDMRSAAKRLTPEAKCDNEERK